MEVYTIFLALPYFGENYVNYILKNPPQNVPGRSLPKEQAPAPPYLPSRPSQKEYYAWYDYWFGAETEGEEEDDNIDDTPSDNHYVQKHNPAGNNSLPKTGEPNSSKDLEDENGAVKQRRWYDENGNASRDVDYSHGGTGHEFPHEHDWIDGQRI